MTREAPGAKPGAGPPDPALEALRAILLERSTKRLEELERRLDELELRTNDDEALAALIAPVIGDVVRRRIRDARDEMVDALYPIIGQTVVRAVGEATRDIVRRIDHQLRQAVNLRAVLDHTRARIRGVSGSELVLRQSLPFDVAEIFLIHRESGLLLWHLARDPEASPDSDLISGMLTAIRDFAATAFGRETESQLEEIQYGERRILIEPGQPAYLAVVVDGIEPSGFRAAMRERLSEINLRHERALRAFTGDQRTLPSLEGPLRSLPLSTAQQPLGPLSWALLIGTVALLVLCGSGVALTGWWISEPALRSSPMVPAVVIALAPSTTTQPTATAPPTASPAPSATPAPTATPTPLAGTMVGDHYIHSVPGDEGSRLGPIVYRGQRVQILAVRDDWYLVRWESGQNGAFTGWVLARWVNSLGPIPEEIITPVVVP